MGAFLNSEDIGVLSSKRFPELVVKQQALLSRKQENLFRINTAEVKCSVTGVEIEAEESQITAHDVPFQGGYGWKKCPLTKVRAQFGELACSSETEAKYFLTDG